MEDHWHDVTISPIATQESFSKKWYGSAKVSGEQDGVPFSASYDFGKPFDTQAEAEVHARAEGDRRAEELRASLPVATVEPVSARPAGEELVTGSSVSGH